jgi:HK97 family phage portal protein
MGLVDFLLGSPPAKPQLQATAGIEIPYYQNNFLNPFNNFRINRSDAMQVPAVARARNIIAGTIATLGLRSFNEVTGQQIEGRSLLKQPDPALALAVTMVWTVEDLLFSGHAFWQVLEVSQDGLPTQARRIDPTRVTFTIDANTNQIVNGFYLDAQLTPANGVGSLIMFSGIDEGILNRGGRTISTALKLEEAVQRMATEPNPTMVIKNTGVDLPPEQVSSLLASWKQARATRSTAYLSGPLDVTTFGYDAGQMQLSESRLNTASEIARMCNIPAWYINAESASATYSNVSQERRSLVDFSLRPFMSCIEERLSMNDLTPRSQVVRFDLDDYLRGNPLEQIEVLTKMLDAGIINLDEARGQMDLAPRGDSLDESSDSTKREMNIAEVVQKVYLGVDKVITSDEAREIVNQAGGSLSLPGPDFAPKGNLNNAS